MIVIDSDTNSGTSTSPRKDTEQDIRIDSLQLAINSINSQITAINSTVSALQTSLNAQINSVTQTLLNSLSSQISALSDSLETQIETGQITASVGNLQRLSVTVSATIKEILTESLKGALVEAESLQADSATITEATIQNLTSPELSATIATIQTINAELLNIISFVVDSLTARNLSATDAEIGNAEIGEVKTNRITGKTWHTPISTPDNTELLKITLPKYDGVLHLTSQDDEISVTVFNNSIVTYNETEGYIYRIERDENENTCVYLANIGDTINYRVLHVGSETFENDYSEIVDKTLFEQNITEKEGALFFYLSDFVDSKDLSFLKGAEDNIQNQINSKQDKTLATPVLINGQRYDSVETAIQQMAAILNGLLVNDIIYNELTEELIFPYNSIAYDSSDEELTVSGFNQVYDSENAELTFSR